MDVSFIIPIFNNSLNELSRMIKSVKQIDESINYEILLIDDGSKNALSVKYKNLSLQSKIKYFKKDNGGVSSARNFGLDKAKGKYILFLDADDQFVAKNFSLPYEDKDLILYNVERKNIETGKNVFLTLNNLKNITKIDILPYLLKDGVLNFVTGKIYLKSFLDRYMIRFNCGITVGEDLDFVTRVLMFNPKLEYINKVLYKYLFKTSTGKERIRIHPLQNLKDALNVYLLREKISKKINVEADLKSALVDDIFEIYSQYLINDAKSAKKNNDLFGEVLYKYGNNLNKKAKIKADLIVNKKYWLILMYLRVRDFYKKVKVGR